MPLFMEVWRLHYFFVGPPFLITTLRVLNCPTLDAAGGDRDGDVSIDAIIRDPLLCLRCDERSLANQPLLPLLLHVMEWALEASSSFFISNDRSLRASKAYPKHSDMKAPLGFNIDRRLKQLSFGFGALNACGEWLSGATVRGGARRTVAQGAMGDVSPEVQTLILAQESVVIHSMLDVLSGVLGGGQTEVLEGGAYRQRCFAFIQARFSRHPRLCHLLHSQGYHKTLVEEMVCEVPCVRSMLCSTLTELMTGAEAAYSHYDFVVELLSQLSKSRPTTDMFHLASSLIHGFCVIPSLLSQLTVLCDMLPSLVRLGQTFPSIKPALLKLLARMRLSTTDYESVAVNAAQRTMAQDTIF